MSAKFCLLIPSKIWQIKKHFPGDLHWWLAQHQDKGACNSGLSSYSLYSLSEFQQRPDVYLDLPDRICDRYHVIDWGFYFMSSPVLMTFLSWLAQIYIYGEVGVLKYWSDKLRRFPPIKISQRGKNIDNLSVSDLPLDEIVFFP